MCYSLSGNCNTCESLNQPSRECCLDRAYYVYYRIRLIKRTVPNKRTPPIFRGNWGTSKRQRSSPYVKSPPRSNQNTYISSCRVCKPALNSAISAVPSRSHCSYSPHDRTIDQLTIFSCVDCCCKRLKHSEQWECEGAITVITLQSAIIEGCGYADVWQHPFYRKFSQALTARCA